MARPKKSEPRDRQLNLSLTALEYASLERRADGLGMRPVHLARALVLNSNDLPVRIPPSPSNLEKLNALALARVGNNLNQLMAYLHSTRHPAPAHLEPLLNEIRQIIARARSR